MTNNSYPIPVYPFSPDYVFLTGTNRLPDVLTFFIHGKDQKTLFCHSIPGSKFASYLPFFSISSGINRIWQSFQGLRDSFHAHEAREGERWNLLKNLFRGIVELIPGINFSLIVYDFLHQRFVIEPSIKREIANLDQDEVQAGVCIDGKILFLLSKKDIPSPKEKKQVRLEALENLFFAKLEKLSKTEKNKNERLLSELLIEAKTTPLTPESSPEK